MARRRRTRVKRTTTKKKKRGRWVYAKGHSRSPRGSNGGKPRPKVRKYKRRFPPKSSYPR